MAEQDAAGPGFGADRSALVAQLTTQLNQAADSVPGTWDGFSFVAELTGLGVRVTGFRYLGSAPGQPILLDNDVIDTVAALRQASPGAGGALFDVFVGRLDHSGAFVGNAFSATDGARFHVTAARVNDIAELIRPGADLAPSAPPPAPAEPSSADGPPGPESAAGADAGVDAGADAAAASIAALTADIAAAATDGWAQYAAVAVFHPSGTHSVGFCYGADGTATPTLVGGAFLANLARLRTLSPDDAGQPARAMMLRLDRAAGETVVAVRPIYDAAIAEQLRWSAADEALADRLRPRRPGIDVAPTRLAAVAPPGGLEPDRLLERALGSVRDSLNGIDGWASYALAVDVELQHAASFCFLAADGRPQRFTPALSPLPDLQALRTMTAGVPPAWSGLCLTAWAGSDRLDVALLDRAGVDALLGAGPDAAAERLRPPAVAPPSAPARPHWQLHQPETIVAGPAPTPALDPSAAFGRLASAITSAPELGQLDWDRFALVIDAESVPPRAAGVRYFGFGPGQPFVVPDLSAVPEFRAGTADAGGALWRVCIIRGLRATRRITTEFHYGPDADEYLGGPDRVRHLAESLRPV